MYFYLYLSQYKHERHSREIFKQSVPLVKVVLGRFCTDALPKVGLFSPLLMTEIAFQPKSFGNCPNRCIKKVFSKKEHEATMDFDLAFYVKTQYSTFSPNCLCYTTKLTLYRESDKQRCLVLPRVFAIWEGCDVIQDVNTKSDL